MTDDASEARFIERLRARDERAFNELVKIYERRVFGLLLRLIGRRDEAEDLGARGLRTGLQGSRGISGRIEALDLDSFASRSTCPKTARSTWRAGKADSQDHFDGVADEVPLHRAKDSSLAIIARPDEIYSGMQLEAIVERSIGELEPEFREVFDFRATSKT